MTRNGYYHGWCGGVPPDITTFPGIFNMIIGCRFRNLYILGLVVMGIAPAVQAAPTIRQPEILPYKCSPTPSMKVDFLHNNEIGKTNNLWRKTGLAVPAVGQPIYIRGVVLDKKCVPVPDAVIQIWQADAKGNYFVEGDDKANIDPYFSASGTAYTNNLGEYSFITILPGSAEDERPYIRFRVKQRGFKTLRTKMYFAGIGNEDKDYKKLSEKKRGLLTAVSDPNGVTSEKDPMTYYFNITLSGKLDYKRY